MSRYGTPAIARGIAGGRDRTGSGVGVHLHPLLPFRGCGDAQSDRLTIARLRAHGCVIGGAVENMDNSELHSSLMLGATVRTAGSCRYSRVMSTLMHRLYRCPNTDLRVQSYACIKTADGAYELVTCNICKDVHLIDRTTGKVLGDDKDARVSEMTGRQIA
jgi:hypothetical protein